MDNQQILERLDSIESRLASLEQHPQPAIQPQQPVAALPERSLAAPPPPPPPSRAGHPARSENASNGLEQWIASHALSLIGIILLVLGIGFFLVYSLQYLGAGGKDLLGVITALILFGLSYWLSHRWGRFSQVLYAGGAAIVYYTAYAMYFSASARVISNQLVDILLLFFIAIGITLSSYFRYRAEIPTLLSILLIFLAVNTGEFSSFTFIGLLVVSAAVTILAWHQHWRMSIFVIMLLTYTTYLGWGHNLHLTGPSQQLATDVFFLSIYYFMFTVPLFSLRQSAAVQIMMFTNSAVYAFGLEPAITQAYPHHGWGVFFFIFALVNAIWIVVARALRASSTQMAAMLLFALSLVFAVPLYFTGVSMTWGWLIVAAGLVTLGYISASRTFAWIGLVTYWLALASFLFNAEDPSVLSPGGVPADALTGFVFFITAIGLGSWQQRAKSLLETATEFFVGNLDVIGLWALAAAVGFLLPRGLTSVAWGLVGVAGLIIGIMNKIRPLRVAGLIVIGITILRIISVDLPALATIYRVVSFVFIGAALLIASWIYHTYLGDKSAPDDQRPQPAPTGAPPPPPPAQG